MTKKVAVVEASMEILIRPKFSKCSSVVEEEVDSALMSDSRPQEIPEEEEVEEDSPSEASVDSGDLMIDLEYPLSQQQQKKISLVTPFQNSSISNQSGGIK